MLKLLVIMMFALCLEMFYMKGCGSLQNCFAVLLLLLCLSAQCMFPIVKLHCIQIEMGLPEISRVAWQVWYRSTGTLMKLSKQGFLWQISSSDVHHDPFDQIMLRFSLRYLHKFWSSALTKTNARNIFGNLWWEKIMDQFTFDGDNVLRLWTVGWGGSSAFH